MKIARVVQRYNKQEGISRGVVEVAERLAKEHEVHVFANSWDDYGNSEIIFHKVPQIPQWPSRYIAQIFGFFVSSARMLKQHDFDIVHLHNSSACASDVVSCHGCPRGGISQVLNTYKDWRKEVSLGDIIKNMLMLPIFEYNYSKKRRKKIIAVSKIIRNELIKFCQVPRDDIVVIPNGVNLDEFNPKNKKIFRNNIRKTLNIKKDDFVFLFVGNYFRMKGLRFALKAISRIKKKKVKLIVVGGLDAPRYQNVFFRLARDTGIKDRVYFLGHTNDVKRFYGASDALILPTIYDAFGLAIIEAMASGLPVITSKSAGAADMIIDNFNGILLEDPTNVRVMVEKMEALIECPKLCDSIGIESRKTTKIYSWDVVAKKTLNLYTEFK
jgi:UDP-glucose:(heptosyl)LPS alpha-1,3-glucosyltransferase